MHQLFQNWERRRQPPIQKPLEVPASILDLFPARAAKAEPLVRNSTVWLGPWSQVPARLWHTQSQPRLWVLLSPGSPCAAWGPRPEARSHQPATTLPWQAAGAQPPCSPTELPWAAGTHPEPGRWASGGGRGCRPGSSSAQVRAGTCCRKVERAPLLLHPLPLLATARPFPLGNPVLRFQNMRTGEADPAPSGLWHEPGLAHQSNAPWYNDWFRDGHVTQPGH